MLDKHRAPPSGAKTLPGLDERFADVRGVRMRYFTGGAAAGPELVLIHGLSGSASNWRPLVALLAARYRVLVPELPGHGGSSPLPAAPSLAPYADRIALVAEREAFRHAIVVGHSLGGLVAVRLALRRPDAVRAVLLVGAAGISSATRRAKKALAISAAVKPGRRLAPLRRTIARRPRLRSLVLRCGVADPAAMTAAVAEAFLESPALYTDVGSAARALVADDVRVGLRALECPVAIVWGARDLQTGVADACEYARRLDAPLRVIADCGHLLIGERPDACARAIDELVASVS
jgi:pimeloyl-ACP methyl ester carboxylesterase